MFSLTLNKYGVGCELDSLGLKYGRVAGFCDHGNTPSDSSIKDG
jgi:hypothetical protein